MYNNGSMGSVSGNIYSGLQGNNVWYPSIEDVYKRQVKLNVIDYQDFIFLPLQACLPPFAVTYITDCKQL